jgi:hypothetical protein
MHAIGASRGEIAGLADESPGVLTSNIIYMINAPPAPGVMVFHNKCQLRAQISDADDIRG